MKVHETTDKRMKLGQSFLANIDDLFSFHPDEVEHVSYRLSLVKEDKKQSSLLKVLVERIR